MFGLAILERVIIPPTLRSFITFLLTPLLSLDRMWINRWSEYGRQNVEVRPRPTILEDSCEDVRKMLQGSRDGTYLKEEKRPTISLIYIHEKTSLTCMLLFILETIKLKSSICQTSFQALGNQRWIINNYGPQEIYFLLLQEQAN